MSSTSRAWAVAATVATVEVLKDQGFCRWNYTLRSLSQHAKTSLRSLSSQASRLSAPPASSLMSKIEETRKEKMKQSDESLRKVIAWAVAATVATVEVLKDQGFCRWNYTLRQLHHHAKTSLRSLSSQTNRLPAAASSSLMSKTEEIRKEKFKQSEESLRKVMYLSCWGPN
ncbi:Protein of unknown function wound-induced [Dillenia turbinata]|uniref:Wound-responsive family protein n=1 Tax=Dillenia turbinata TaxID=194707 RepID=A0AAN8ZTZ7_9MAGN